MPAHELHEKTAPEVEATKPSQKDSHPAKPSIEQHSTGANSSNVVTGDNSSVEIKQE